MTGSRQGGEAFQFHAVGGDDDLVRFEADVVPAFEHVHQRLRDGGEALASAQGGEGAVPGGTERAGRLEVDLEDGGDAMEQSEDRRLREPRVEQVGVEGAGALDGLPGEQAAAGRGEPFDGEVGTQAVVGFQIDGGRWMLDGGDEQGQVVTQLGEGGAGFHHLDAVGGVGGDLRTGGRDDLHAVSSSRFMILSPSRTVQPMETTKYPATIAAPTRYPPRGTSRKMSATSTAPVTAAMRSG